MTPEANGCITASTPSGSGTVNTTYVYDANGNMTSGNGRVAAWTSFSMVATIGQGTKTVAFDYDGKHSCIRQVTNANTTLYLNDRGSGLRGECVPRGLLESFCERDITRHDAPAEISQLALGICDSISFEIPP